VTGGVRRTTKYINKHPILRPGVKSAHLVISKWSFALKSQTEIFWEKSNNWRKKKSSNFERMGPGKDDVTVQFL